MVIAGIFTATMSSLNTSINSMSSAIVTDYLRIWRTGFTPRQPSLCEDNVRRIRADGNGIVSAYVCI